MSEHAGGYYQTRADDLGLAEVPEILNGKPIRLLAAGERPEASLVAGRFAAAVTSAEDYALDGVHGVYEASGWPLTVPQWRHIRSLPPKGRLRSAAEHATARVVPELLHAFPLHGGEIYLEALARSEVSRSMLYRAAINTYLAREPIEESAQVYLLTRTVHGVGRSCTAAYFSLLWAQHVPSIPNCSHYETLSPRYMGAQLLSGEVAALPALVPQPH